MNVNFRMIIFWTTLVLCISQSTAWWWRSSDPSPQDLPSYLPPAVYYQQRLLKTHPVNLPPPQYAPQGGGDPSAGTVAVPAIPIQVPLQAQLAPVPNVHNVQLVPCLCPVQQEEYHEKPMDGIYNSKKDV